MHPATVGAAELATSNGHRFDGEKLGGGFRGASSGRGEDEERTAVQIDTTLSSYIVERGPGFPNFA